MRALETFYARETISDVINDLGRNRKNAVINNGRSMLRTYNQLTPLAKTINNKKLDRLSRLFCISVVIYF